MSRLYSIDLSMRTGVALFENDKLQSFGCHVGKRPSGNYDPKNLIDLIDNLISEIFEEILEVKPNEIVIEQTNRGRNRYTQKTLEWLHLTLLRKLYAYDTINTYKWKVYYLDTSEWKKIMGIKVDKEIRKHNREIKKNKERGLIKVKHVSIMSVNERYDLSLMLKEDDEAEAILLGEAFIKIKNEIGLEKYYSEREIKMKTARKEGTQRTKKRRARNARNIN